MTRRFRGESLHKVDIKGRVSVPAAFRRVLEEGDPDFTGGSFPNFVIKRIINNICYFLKIINLIKFVVNYK